MVKSHHKTHIKHKSNTYEYHRAYYQLLTKPFTNKKDNFAEGRYKCVLCGFKRRLAVFKTLKLPNFLIITSGREGFKWSEPNLDDTRVKSVFNSYIQTLVSRCREFLAMYDPEYRKLTLTQEISREVGSNQSLFPTTLFINSGVGINSCVAVAPKMVAIEGIQMRKV